MVLEKIKIITDSTCDLPRNLIEEYDIEVLPLLVFFGEEGYLDGVDIKLNEFLRKMKETNIFPTTSQVVPQRFYDCYKKYLDEGYKIISIHISSKMSGTYQSACLAKEMLNSNDITVIDSLNVTSGLGLLVIKACKLFKQGFKVEEIERTIKETIPHVKSALAFESLENLVKGGRLSKAAGIIVNALGIKLILDVDNGEMAVFDKVRGTKKAIKTIINFMENKGVKSGEPCLLLHVEGEEVLNALREDLLQKSQEFIETEVGCVVGTHSGAGACGVFFIEEF